ncbi:MAG: glycogen synthase [Deltaproteobacteria bacterium]|nr:glycogen synthase [Deltaproteobacteria bacterium]
MRILYLSPELWPFSKVGGLADVAHDLSCALGRQGHEVLVVTPKCRLVPELEEKLTRLDLWLEVPVSFKRHQVGVYTYPLGQGATAYLLEHESLFSRDGLYGNAYGDYEDNAERFILFSRACLELAVALGLPLDIIHANDWTTGLVPLYVKSLYAHEPGLAGAGTVMTIHNLGNQGTFWHYDMPLTGLGWEYFVPEKVEFYGKINFLKAGLVSADLVTTVSPTYAREILGPELGFGLEGVLLSRQDRLAAVVNGIDYEAWDPQSDPHLAANFGPDSLDSKAVCRQDLMAMLGLPAGDKRPLVAVVGRLQERKGMDLLAASLDELFKLELNLVVAGQGDDYFQRLFLERSGQMRDRLAVRLELDTALVHKVIAGSDLLLAPSRYEPCGLHQLQAMRYGTVPVVRATGGLDDTVTAFEGGEAGTGFKFHAYQTPALIEALERALAVYAEPAKWRGLMRRAMEQDFSWQAAVKGYEGLYQRARDVRQAEGAA